MELIMLTEKKSRWEWFIYLFLSYYFPLKSVIQLEMLTEWKLPSHYWSSADFEDPLGAN